ncbi:vancomycin resistance protein YoaR [Caldicoprobacter guelmensis]|uniref:VanW family protein n=1 Tax=Caldicoprobacter guelmensis TaxID=1170224 RepID=UPI00195ED829|nr:VanW family protein [Caldicoprobacter guelmensis]MBM7582361.1 vancomycin resistance protein YoaR [Caldicoprobacter guelmensis]
MQSTTQSEREAVGRKAAQKKKKSVIYKARVMIVFTLAFLAILGAGAYAYNILNSNHFYPGVTVDGLPMQGLTFEEGLEAIRKLRQPELDAIKLTLRHGKYEWEYNYQNIGASFNIEDVVEEAYRVGRVGNIFERLMEIYEVGKKGRQFTTVLTYDVSLLKNELEAIARQINIQPVDAQIEFHPDSKQKFTFTKEVIGKGMLIEQAMADIKAKVDAKDFTPYEIPVQTLYPRYTLDEVKTWTSRIAVYSTKLSGTPERIHNITLSSKSFDGLRLDPGEVFSFNEATGPRDKAHGYLDAPVIKEGRKLVDEPGGGNCQTSTTLYGAAVRADLEILERWHHSWPSAYTEVGQDATVNYPTLDLKIRNNKDTPVFFNRYISNGRLYVEVYGKAPTAYDKIELISVILEQTDKPPEKVVQDNTLKPGEEVIEYESRPGIKVQTYRVYYKDGKEVKRVKEAYSNYPRIVGKKRVGPPKPPEEVAPEAGSPGETLKPDEQPADSGVNNGGAPSAQNGTEIPSDEMVN